MGVRHILNCYKLRHNNKVQLSEAYNAFGVYLQLCHSWTTASRLILLPSLGHQFLSFLPWKISQFSLCFVSNETTQTYALITSPLALAPAFPLFLLALPILPTAWPQTHYSSGSQTWVSNRITWKAPYITDRPALRTEQVGVSAKCH